MRSEHLHPCAHRLNEQETSPTPHPPSLCVLSLLALPPLTLPTGDSCRTQKIRCEGGTPEAPCARCVLKSTACTFEERGKTKQPPKSYVESLEMRLEAMEALLRKVSRTAERDIEALGERGSLMGGGDEVVGGSVESSPVGDGKEGEEPREEEMDALGDEVHELSIDKVRSFLLSDAILRR